MKFPAPIRKVQSMWGKEPGKLLSQASLCGFLSLTSLFSYLPLIASMKHLLLFSTLEEVSGPGWWQFLFPLSYKVNLQTVKLRNNSQWTMIAHFLNSSLNIQETLVSCQQIWFFGQLQMSILPCDGNKMGPQSSVIKKRTLEGCDFIS